MSRAAKEALFEEIAAMGKALASPRRLELLDLLAQAPRSVDELAREIDQSSANTSQHLQALHAAGLVERERAGTHVRYSIAGDAPVRLWLALRDAAASQRAGVERAAREYLGEPVEVISPGELRKRMRRGDVVLIDVRPAVEFEAGHIEGARSIPVEELEERINELPPDTEVVAYCRGRYCVYADEAVRRLASAGRPASRLEGGWPEWKLGRKARARKEAA